MAANPLAFLISSSARERHALTASTLGWMLDGMDVTLYAMVLRELLRELQLSAAQAGLLASVTLIASAVGGILFGLVADRFGRRVALIASIIVYSAFTAACGFSHGLWELAALRLGVGLGMGGEWATGAALVSETWPDQHRGKALGFMQSGFAIGYALAAIVAALIMPRWGWRPVFFAGIFPALVTLWIGRNVEESPLWLAQRKEDGKRGKGRGTRTNTGFGVRDWRFGPGDSESGTPTAAAGIRDAESHIRNPASEIQGAGHGVRKERTLDAPLEARDLKAESRTPNPVSCVANPLPRSLPRYGIVILVTTLMNSAALFGWWGLFTWIPSYLAPPLARGGRGLSLAASSAWIIAMQAGMWLGYVTFGFASDAWGRKRTYVFYLFVAALLVPLYARSRPLALLVVGPLLAFFGTGHFTGFGVMTAELFPTSFRASAMGLTYNCGRALSAAAPWVIGLVAAHGGLGSAFGISGLAFFLAGVLALALPETRGRSLA
ncbi:MAG: MFS transporter [Terriglobia bacterium]